MRKIKKIVPAVREDISDLETYRAMPTRHLDMIDPFIFLNHHGPQVYLPQNGGLPFGPHPHRGFETVTFIIEGDIAHRDSGGHESIIKKGGVQWMTAGRGLVHEEVSSKEFMEEGGALEILQLWVNLPAKIKMTKPSYRGVQAEGIPKVLGEGQTIEVVSGKVNGVDGAFLSLTNVTSMLLTIAGGAHSQLRIPREENIFFYVIRGELKVNEHLVTEKNTALFENNDELILIQAIKPAKILICHARPYNEPIVSYGPFVMNTEEEIDQAIRDYQSGKFNEIL